MNDTVKLIIEIPISDYEWLKKLAKGNTFIPVYDALAKAFLNGTPLDDVKAEIEKAVWEDVIVSRDGTDEELRIPRLEPDDVFDILDNIGKTESEE